MLKSDKKPGGLAEHAAALAQMRHDADMTIAARERIADAPRPPSSNTGATLRHEGSDPAFAGEEASWRKVPSHATAQSSPPPNTEKKKRTRAAKTTPEMEAFLKLWFFDWLSVTVPNGADGTGCRRGTNPAEPLANAAKSEDEAERERAREQIQQELLIGEAEEAAGHDKLCLWAVSRGLHVTKLGKAPDGYEAGLRFGQSPVATEVCDIVRGGHTTNMPGMILPGADGMCAKLAPSALRLLAPLLASRIDVSWDHSQHGYFDALWKYAVEASETNGMAPPELTDKGEGRSFEWGDSKDGQASVTVYEKDRERVAKKKLAAEDCDPNLVRVEFRFAPKKSAKKAGFAKLADEGGPGALLGAVHWVRKMVQHIAEITGEVRAEDARMGVGRIERTPVVKTAMDRAAHGVAQYARALCEAAAAEIVKEQHDGDWLGAEIEPLELRKRVMGMVTVMLDESDMPERVVRRCGLDAVRNVEAEAARNAADLRDYIERQRARAAAAQEALMEAAERAAEMLGVPMGQAA